MPRPSYAQAEALIDFMEKNQELARGRLNSADARMRSDAMWRQVAASLNTMGACSKDAATWRKFWNDKKVNCKKAAALRYKTAQKTGGGNDNLSDIPALDLRILAIMGDEYGCGIPDVAPPPFPVQDEVANMPDLHAIESLPIISEIVLEHDYATNSTKIDVDVNTISEDMGSFDCNEPRASLQPAAKQKVKEASSGTPSGSRFKSGLRSTHDRLLAMEQQRIDAETRLSLAVESLTSHIIQGREERQAVAMAQSKTAELQAKAAQSLSRAAEALVIATQALTEAALRINRN